MNWSPFFAALASSSWDTLLEMAPYLLFGFFVAGVLSEVISPAAVERHMGRRGFMSILKASALGIPLPLCSCGVIPVTASIRRHGASRGATLSFLLSTPQTGVDSIMVTYSLLGGVFALVRPLVALVCGLFGGVLAEAVEREDDGPPVQDPAPASGSCCATAPEPAKASCCTAPVKASCCAAPPSPGSCCAAPPSPGSCCATAAAPVKASCCTAPQPSTLAPVTDSCCSTESAPVTASCCSASHGSAPVAGFRGALARAMRYGFVTIPGDIAGSLALGVVLAGAISAMVPQGYLETLMGRGVGAKLIMMAVGIPLYVCATASVPIAAALMAKGVSAGAALVFLMTGPVTNAASITTVTRILGARTTAVYLFTVVAVALGAGTLMDMGTYDFSSAAAACLMHTGPAPVWKIASALVLIALLVNSRIASKRGE